MKFYIIQNSTELGPFTRPEINARLAAGLTRAGDPARREGSRDVFPLSTLLDESPSPMPPELHWGIVLVLGVLSRGLFISIWVLVQFNWIRKLDKDPTAFIILIITLAIQWGSLLLSFASLKEEAVILLNALIIITLPIQFYAAWRGRATMLKHFNNVEHYRLELSPIWSLIFTAPYLQYHMSRIAEWKRTGQKG